MTKHLMEFLMDTYNVDLGPETIMVQKEPSFGPPVPVCQHLCIRHRLLRLNYKIVFPKQSQIALCKQHLHKHLVSLPQDATTVNENIPFYSSSCDVNRTLTRIVEKRFRKIEHARNRSYSRNKNSRRDLFNNLMKFEQQLSEHGLEEYLSPEMMINEFSNNSQSNSTTGQNKKVESEQQIPST
ncbi:unnamed protein product [Didymodactylos carnosus]|uniref:Uncharacterized protein n=1 Tax=Didymodactylos carnosus TaxID=1234261 RepID=A0A814IQ72_9BILA|nr:unnamed protein product [Didymodactylos carnosus]CAF1027294.1 unnamed protein product [Didymodactylos carnosus]CAF3639077.1 unnamed protein product [Didymodactylos carnosus]CAF3798278.1 unnamed protein product [Didymodactylos carnosus]